MLMPSVLQADRGDAAGKGTPRNTNLGYVYNHRPRTGRVLAVGLYEPNHILPRHLRAAETTVFPVGISISTPITFPKVYYLHYLMDKLKI